MKQVSLRCGRCSVDLNDVYLCNYHDCNYKDKNGDSIINRPNPDDLITIQSEPTQEQEIERLQEALLFQNKKIVQLTEENKRLKEQLFPTTNY